MKIGLRDYFLIYSSKKKREINETKSVPVKVGRDEGIPCSIRTLNTFTYIIFVVFVKKLFANVKNEYNITYYGRSAYSNNIILADYHRRNVL